MFYAHQLIYYYFNKVSQNWIEKKNFRTIKKRIYFMFYHKLKKLKKYFDENFRKNFIIVNSIFFVSFVLFIIKFNDDFRFCVNYWKLNIIIKRNRYFILCFDKLSICFVERFDCQIKRVFYQNMKYHWSKKFWRKLLTSNILRN